MYTDASPCYLRWPGDYACTCTLLAWDLLILVRITCKGFFFLAFIKTFKSSITLCGQFIFSHAYTGTFLSETKVWWKFSWSGGWPVWLKAYLIHNCGECIPKGEIPLRGEAFLVKGVLTKINHNINHNWSPTRFIIIFPIWTLYGSLSSWRFD